MTGQTTLDTAALGAVRDAALNQQPVTGGPHDFYRYPARFAPQFAAAAIQAFSQPGDLVLDPFLGGGTTLVEAQRLGRRSVGYDINPLATFVSEAKTTLYSKQALDGLSAWQARIPSTLNAHASAIIDPFWEDNGYLRNFSGTEGWALRKLIAQAVSSFVNLSDKPRLLARCALLRTAQWALDLRDVLPSARDFREQLDRNIEMMTGQARSYRREVHLVAPSVEDRALLRPAILQRSAEDVIDNKLITKVRPSLVLTSPPYPGVYVLYHRWKIHARRETPLPYWITNSLDGRGMSHYILGPRLETNLKSYFDNLRLCFSSVASVAPDATFVQVVGFSNPSDQLPRYLDALEDAGLQEVQFDSCATNSDGRLWRNVPGRRWFAKHQKTASNEVVLFHRASG
jgi:DNA methylase